MESIDAEYQEAAPLAVQDVPSAAPAALFGTDDPIQILEHAVRVADALKAVVDRKGLIATIQGKKYPLVEAWQTMGAMLNLTSVLEWCRRCDKGWEASVVIMRRGEVIARAEAQCCKDEKGKGTWEDYAIRSMSQTRATSKAYRSALAFVMVLAGYEATPMEEMPISTEVRPSQPRYTREELIRIERTNRLKELLVQAKKYGCITASDVLVTNGPTLREWAQSVTAGCDDWASGTQPLLQHIEHMETAMAAISEQLDDGVPF